jgi:hypothetical protein
MTYQEIHEKFEAALPKFRKIIGYESFDEIPEDFRVPESLFVWVFDAPERLKEIPLAWLDHDIRLAAVCNAGETIEFIAMEDTDRYEELALCAIGSRPAALDQINSSVYSDHFFIEAIKARSDVVFHFRQVIDNGYKLSREVVSAVFEHSISSMSALIGAEGFADLVTDEIVVKGVLTSFVDQYAWWIDLDSLELLGKTSVVQEAISSGFWPITLRIESDEPYFPDVIRPTSLPDAIAAYQSASNINIADLFKFVVLSYGPDEVISSLHSTSDGLDVLQSLYTDQELAPFSKKYRGLKGRFLEDSLGL